jgi:hypothetical protein
MFDPKIALFLCDRAFGAGRYAISVSTIVDSISNRPCVANWQYGLYESASISGCDFQLSAQVPHSFPHPGNPDPDSS